MNKKCQIVLWIAWGGLAAWGAVGVYQRLTEGLVDANVGSYVPWGLWTAAYIYFIGLSAGAFLFSSLVFVFRFEALEKIGRVALFTAAIALISGLFIVWVHLGSMWRFYELFTRPNFSSVMAWVTWMYAAYFVLILSELWLITRFDLADRAALGESGSWFYRILSFGWRPPTESDQREMALQRNRNILRWVAAMGIPLAIAFHGGVGALFATLPARPYWNTSLYPVLFLTGALYSGGGLLLAISAMIDLGDKAAQARILKLLSRVVLGLMVLDLFVVVAEHSIPMWYAIGHEYEVHRQIHFGPTWYLFWIFQILLGALVPATLLLWKPASRWATGLAGAMIALAFLAVRINIVLPGETSPQLQGIEIAYVDQRLLFEYVPSAFEWSVVAFTVAMAIAIFYLGKRYLPLIESRWQLH
jgi:protein NrfD